jgi:hypothetical protein
LMRSLRRDGSIPMFTGDRQTFSPPGRRCDHQIRSYC